VDGGQILFLLPEYGKLKGFISLVGLLRLTGIAIVT